MINIDVQPQIKCFICTSTSES